MSLSELGVGQAKPAAVSANDVALVRALREGDEAAFTVLVEQWHPSMVRLALLYVNGRAAAEEVAQETWLAVLQGIGRFEGRSSLKTWVFHILANRAKTRGVRDGRVAPFSSLANLDDDGDEPAVDLDRFLPPDHQWAGHWAAPPKSWAALPEEALLGGEIRARVQAAIDLLPPNQKAIITLRDVEGWTAEEVSTTLSITDGNQRVLLHRARSRVRATLEQYLREAEA